MDKPPDVIYIIDDIPKFDLNSYEPTKTKGKKDGSTHKEKPEESTDSRQG